MGKLKQEQIGSSTGLGISISINQSKQGHCILCPEIISKSSKCDTKVTKASHSKFEHDIKSFYDLFSLPPNYFRDDLQVSSVTLRKNLCLSCRKRIELISSAFKEIDKLKKKLEELKTAVEKDLTLVTSGEVDEIDTALENLECEFSRQRIREELQQKIQVTHESASNVYTKLENIVDQIDTDLLFGASASPINSNFGETEEDVFNEKDEEENAILDQDQIKQEGVDPLESNLNENQTDNDPDFINDDQELSENSDSDTKPTQRSVKRKKSLKSRSKISKSVKSGKSVVAGSRSGTKLKSRTPKKKLTPSELRLVKEANLKQCSIIVTRLNEPAAPSKLKKRRSRPLKSDLTCKHCSRVCINVTSLQIHRSRAHPETFPFICTDCNQGFCKDTLLKRHQKLHESNHNLKFYCQTCNAEFENRQSLLEHRKVHPWKRPRRVCARCGKSFGKGNQLLYHERKYHGAPYPHVCSFCKKGFNIKKELDAHEANHKGEKNFQCDKCPSQFASQTALDRHIGWRHVRFTDETYECQVCSRTYKTKGGLKMHLKTHTGERPFVCDVCGMSFVFKEKLEKHQSIHTKERPYLCQECGFSCRLKELLRSHEKVHEMHRKLRENIQKEAGSDGASIELLKRLPVPRLAKPRNRSLRFPKINPALIVIPTALTEPEMNCGVTVTESVPEPEVEQELEADSVGTTEIENSSAADLPFWSY